MVAWRRLDRVPSDSLAWLLACARRSLLNHQRAERRRSRLADRLTADTSRREVRVELRDDLLARAFATLQERDREALLLIGWEGLSVEQAAAVIGCSSQAFRVRTHRARRRLADALLALDAAESHLRMEPCND